MRQHSLCSATLDSWAKSFNLPTVIGTDVVDRLRDSLHKLGHNHIEVVAILNDTTSVLVITNTFKLKRNISDFNVLFLKDSWRNTR